MTGYDFHGEGRPFFRDAVYVFFALISI